MYSIREDIRWNTRFPKKRKSCKKQGRYRTQIEASSKADTYNQRVLFADMQVYWCWRHQRWHIGHASKN